VLFSADLETIILERHNLVRADELVIVSGYVGPSSVEKLSTLPFQTTVVYGMYGSDRISQRMHSSLRRLSDQIPQVQILYSNVPVHAKLYLWKFSGNITHALVGSANFTANGLNSPFREVLAEATVDTFTPLEQYVEKVLGNSIECSAAELIEDLRQEPEPQIITTPDGQIICEMTLLDPRTGEVQENHGLNWGQSVRSHVRPNDACIPIRASHIRTYPTIFPPKESRPLHTDGEGRSSRQNDYVEILWDDGSSFEALFEGSQPVDGVRYPKQISSYPHKDTLGKYIRDRIGVPHGQRVTAADLNAYGRTHIHVSVIEERIYYFDFSV